MLSMNQEQKFLYAFYEIANQKAPDNLVKIATVGQHCGMDESKARAIAQTLVDEGFLEPKGLSPSTYRLTPKGRHEVRDMFRHPDTRGELSPRMTVSMAALGAADLGTIGEQRLGTEDREAVLGVLRLMTDYLSTVERLAGYAQAQVYDVIAEIEAELHESTPNVLRLRGLLMGLAMATHVSDPNNRLDHEANVALSFLGIDLL